MSITSFLPAPQFHKIRSVRKRFKIIVNPFAGRGQARKKAHDVAEHLRKKGCRVDLVKQREPDPTQGDPDAIIAVGGDGTINGVLNSLPDNPPPFGVIPSGTGNALAKEVRLPEDPEFLSTVLCDGKPTPWDYGVERNHNKRFLMFFSVGYDAFVVNDFHAWRKGTIYQWQYFLWGVKSILPFQIPKIGVEIDGHPITDCATWVQVSNVSEYGGPMIFTPKAGPETKSLEVMIYRAPFKRDLPRMYLRALLLWLTGFDYPMHDLTCHRAQKVRLWSADGRPVPTQFDGDPGNPLPAEISVVPGALPMLLPK